MADIWRSVAMKVLRSRTLPLLAAMVAGALLPQAHVAAGLIRWLVSWMLFAVFLRTPWSRDLLRRSHGLLLIANVAVGLSAWALARRWGGHDVGLAAFFCGITPTAIAAPVITNFLRGRVGYVTGAFLLSNLTIAALMPLLLPMVLGEPTPGLMANIGQRMGTLVFAPFVVAWIVRRAVPRSLEWAERLGNWNFGVWVLAIFLITANASHFLGTQRQLSPLIVWEIAGAALLTCMTSFALGRWIGGGEFALEASQSLGQKNTTFTIFLAMTYASPLVALGPTFYVVWHNLWNSWQLHRADGKWSKGEPG